MRSLLVCIISVIFGSWNAVWGLPENWEWQNPQPTGNDLVDVAMVDADNGWAVGLYGTLLRTTNGGNTWQLLPDSTHYHLRSVCFVDPQTGWISGYEDFSDRHALILHTTDGGLTWIRQTLPVNESMDLVQFLDAENGFATVCNPYGNGRLLHTTNGGVDWTTRGDSRAFLTTHFLNNDLGWAISWRVSPDSSYIFRTTDGGETWSERFVICTAYLMALCSVSETEGWAVGERGIILHTTDGGESWQYQLQDSISTIRDVVFADSLLGYALGRMDSELLSFVTTDGGNTWNVQPIGLSQNGVLAMALSDATHLIVVGSRGTILRSEGGTSWTEVSRHQINQAVRPIMFADSLNGWIGGVGFADDDWYGSILHTTDGGESWNEQRPGVTGWIEAMDFVDPLIGWAVGAGGELLHTTDGGEAWSEQLGGFGLSVIDFTDSQIGMGISYQTVWRTTDGGGTWSQSSNAEWGSLTDIEVASLNEAWIVGTLWSPNYTNDTGVVAHTEDGGSTWDTQQFLNKRFYSIDFSDADHGCIAAYANDDGSPLLYTTDGGTTWNVPAAWPMTEVYNISFAGRLEAWAVANSGTICHSTDGGASWGWESFITNMGLRNIAFGDPRHGWIIGNSGALLRYTGTITSIPHKPEAFVPNALSLSIFPNPFNPVTTLSFDLPVSARVKLAIYDITGRQVAVPADAVFTAGMHSVRFDGSTLASGIYFARLETMEQTQTHKLVLLK